jgi:hypothetical protein
MSWLVATNRSSRSKHGSSEMMIRANHPAARLRISLYLSYNPINLAEKHESDLSRIFAF